MATVPAGSGASPHQRLLSRWSREDDVAVAAALDATRTADLADHLIALADGRLHAAGDPATVLTEACVRAAFGLDSQVITDPTSGKPPMLPLGRHHVYPHM
uniref:hypothetical protein n=1 Tax=Paractinoplanes polyasparticus TaxID=2856853 RepID=UPI0021053624|nr:hypothetical protein [Actinoplanes polyasparticus]